MALICHFKNIMTVMDGRIEYTAQNAAGYSEHIRRPEHGAGQGTGRTLFTGIPDG